MQKSHSMDLVLIRSLLAVADAGIDHRCRRRRSTSASPPCPAACSNSRPTSAHSSWSGAATASSSPISDVRPSRRAEPSWPGTTASAGSIAEQQNLERGVVRIGGGATVTSFLLPAAIAAFHSSHPGIRFYVKEAGSREIAAAVSRR